MRYEVLIGGPMDVNRCVLTDEAVGAAAATDCVSKVDGVISIERS